MHTALYQVLDDVRTGKRISTATYETKPGQQGVGPTPEAASPVEGHVDDNMADTREEKGAEDEVAERLRVQPADIVCAFNYSLCLMHSRATGLQYLRCWLTL